jgi:hypothetical protein
MPYFAGTDGGISSVGRALAWHARGHQFEPGILHFFWHQSMKHSNPKYLQLYKKQC